MLNHTVRFPLPLPQPNLRFLLSFTHNSDFLQIWSGRHPLPEQARVSTPWYHHHEELWYPTRGFWLLPQFEVCALFQKTRTGLGASSSNHHQNHWKENIFNVINICTITVAPIVGSKLVILATTKEGGAEGLKWCNMLQNSPSTLSILTNFRLVNRWSQGCWKCTRSPRSPIQLHPMISSVWMIPAAPDL